MIKDEREYIYEDAENSLFPNEVNGIKLTRRFVKNTKKTYEDIFKEYYNMVLNKELN